MAGAHYQQVLDIVAAADGKPHPEESIQCIYQKRGEIQLAITNLHQQKRWPELGAVLRIIRDVSDYGLFPVETISPCEKECEALKKNKAAIEEEYGRACRLRAEKLLQTALESDIKHTDRHRLIEKAIRLVLSLHKPDQINPEDAAFLARCYLERSRLVLPKGSSLPEKKLEALEKAERYARMAGLGPRDDLFMIIRLEQLMWDERADRSAIKKELEAYLESPAFTRASSFHAFAAGHARRFGFGKSDLDDFILGFPSSDKDAGRDPYAPWLSLLKCEAAARKNADLSSSASALIEDLEKTPFSSRLWDESVDFFEKHKTLGDVAVGLWRACKKREEQTPLSLQVRWYWARHKRLYELAFRRAWEKNEYHLAAEIADTQKNRPTIKMLAIERMLSRDERSFLADLIEADATFAAGGFCKGYDDLFEKLSGKKPERQSARSLNEVPEGWAAVHLFVAEGKECHAILARQGEAPTSLHGHSPLNAEGLERAYRSYVKDQTNGAMRDLCEKAGELFGFLFDVPEQRLVIIPHGFLHMIPLHAAYRDKTYLFEKKECLYLPSWSLMPHKTPPRAKGGGAYVFQNYGDSDAYDDLESRVQYIKKIKKDATLEDICSLKAAPELLVVICHGIGDRDNPYNSRLLLAGGGATHKELRQRLPRLDGTRVILSVCESDFAPGGIGPVDEHLSIASAFLAAGATEVASGLFELDAGMCSEFIRRALENPDRSLSETLIDLQKEWHGKKEDINHIAPFRVMGFPA